jgi:hypothetical protein
MAIPKAMQTRSGSIPFINAEGKPDELPLGELEAVERSGCSSWQTYIMQRPQWAPPSAPVVPLMEARPGQTDPVVPFHTLNRDGEVWTYGEICQAIRSNPKTHRERAALGAIMRRSPDGIQNVLLRVESLRSQRKLMWVGDRLLRGTKAQVYQWPIGFRNP